MTRSSYWQLAIAVGLVCLGLGAISGSVVAQDTTPDPPFGVWISPTPDENGNISVIVQPNESLWIIAARAGLTLPDLLALNSLTENDVIRPGDVILVGTGTPPPTVFSTVEGTPTATRLPPTLRPTQAPEAATICLTAFEDTNQDGIQNPGETATTGVAFTVFNRDQVVANVITDGRPEAHCLPGLVPGEYYVTRSLMPGEILTTDGDWALVIAANNILQQAFGSVRSAATPSAAVTTPAPDEEAIAATGGESTLPQETNSPANSERIMWGGVGVLAVGGLLLLAAVLLLWFRRARVQ